VVLVSSVVDVMVDFVELLVEVDVVVLLDDELEGTEAALAAPADVGREYTLSLPPAPQNS
jgi:hypothetical protein